MVRCASAVEEKIGNWILTINDCDEPPKPRAASCNKKKNGKIQESQDQMEEMKKES